MKRDDTKVKKFNLKNSDKIKEFFASSKTLTTKKESLIDDSSKPIEVDKDGMEIFYIEDFNEPKEKIIEEDNSEYVFLEGFNEFEEVEEVVEENEDDFEEYEGNEHICAKAEDEEDFDEYEGNDSLITALGKDVDFEELSDEKENSADTLEYEEYVATKEVDDREYEYIEYDSEENENEENER